MKEAFQKPEFDCSTKSAKHQATLEGLDPRKTTPKETFVDRSLELICKLSRQKHEVTQEVTSALTSEDLASVSFLLMFLASAQWDLRPHQACRGTTFLNKQEYFSNRLRERGRGLKEEQTD